MNPGALKDIKTLVPAFATRALVLEAKKTHEVVVA